jgi:hypothetical protein
MREFFDDFNDIEFDDNEIIERLMREMEEGDRRQKNAGAAGPRSKRRFGFDDRSTDDDEVDEEYDDEFDGDEEYEVYDDYDEDRY